MASRIDEVWQEAMDARWVMAAEELRNLPTGEDLRDTLSTKAENPTAFKKLDAETKCEAESRLKQIPGSKSERTW